MPAWHNLDSGRPCESPRSAYDTWAVPLALGCEHLGMAGSACVADRSITV